MDTSLLVIACSVTAAVFLYMTLWFAMAFYVKRIDIIDCAWGLGFIYVALITLYIDGRFEPIQLLTVLFTAIWGIRLFVHILSRLVKKPEDKRYTAFRKKWGDNFWSKTYTNIFLVQGVLLLLISSATIATITSHHAPLLVVSVIGFSIWTFGIVFEAISDYQLRQFVVRSKAEGTRGIMDKGLWRYSRHPNYFGEITTWLGAGIAALSVGAWWGLLGFVVITFLIVKVSGIPPIEKERAKDEAYQQYQKRTSVLVPLPPKS